MNLNRRIRWMLFCLNVLFVTPFMTAKSPLVAYDLAQAQEICRELPLESIEGIWNYPEDKVTVLILGDEENRLSHGYDKYTISVVETEDARLKPGEIIGMLTSTASADEYRIELVTERKNDLLLKPKSCLATLSKDGDSFIIKKQKSGLRGRLNLNLNRLLPGFWKIVSTGISTASGSIIETPVGMIKIYPSYDGNGSSRRKVRYL